MRNLFLALTMLFALGVQADTKVQMGPGGVTIEQTDAPQKDEVEAFSDTTTTDSIAGSTPIVTVSADDDDDLAVSRIESIVERAISDDAAVEALAVVMIVFVFLLMFVPVIAIVLLFYLIYRNRRQRMQLARQAMDKGQPLEQPAPQPSVPADTDLWAKGMRQLSLGMGLIVLFLLLDSRLGIGIGALVVFIGAGNLFIEQKQRRRNSSENQLNNTL